MAASAPVAGGEGVRVARWPSTRCDGVPVRGGLGDGLVGGVVRVRGAVHAVGEVPGLVVGLLRGGGGPVRVGGGDRGEVPGRGVLERPGTWPAASGQCRGWVVTVSVAMSPDTVNV